ncbi:hypothetical protein AMS68_001010 [Peltaster fructicola]|uniref:Uncharacterized protein n=1 Tax=Peltaster fructicola TaxID=286661 RepID=A0A6H0XLA1_9PEZI|nr:hypothetical protein AMS68_001010 [Peltaster fructicola]
MPFHSAFSLRSRVSSPELSFTHKHTPVQAPSAAGTDNPFVPQSSLPLSVLSSEVTDGYKSRFMEEVSSAIDRVDGHAATTPMSEEVPTYKAARQIDSASTSPTPREIINPASIPTRTSSSNATDSPRSARPRRSLLSHSRQGSRTQNTIPEEPKSPTRSSERNSDPAKAALMSAFPLPPGHAAAESRQTNGHTDTVAGSGQELINGDTAIWTAEKENILNGPFNYLEQHPGKDIRGEMIAAFNAWLQVPKASLDIITKVVGMLHTASLLIDDVEDSSLLRRGVPVAHSIFGTAQTINSANYVYFCALQELLRLGNPEAIRIFTEELLNLHRGQGMDLFWRDTLTCPSEDDYLEMVGNKTGGLFRLAIKLMCAESTVHNSVLASPAQRSDYIPLVNTVGLLFQILDDYRNLSDGTYTANKGLCEDLTEGKFSFPVIHSIRTDPSNLVLINILKQKTQDEEVKRYALMYMERTGSFAYTRRVLRGLTKKALALIDELDAGQGKGDSIRAILEKLRIDRHSRTSSVP